MAKSTGQFTSMNDVRPGRAIEPDDVSTRIAAENRSWLAGATPMNGAPRLFGRRAGRGRWQRGRRPAQRHARHPQTIRRVSISATLRTSAEPSTMPRLFIIASHIVVIVIIMILYRFPLSVGVVAVLFHGPRLVWPLGARRSHVQSRKTCFPRGNFIVFYSFPVAILCARTAVWPRRVRFQRFVAAADCTI